MNRFWLKFLSTVGWCLLLMYGSCFVVSVLLILANPHTDKSSGFFIDYAFLLATLGAGLVKGAQANMIK